MIPITKVNSVNARTFVIHLAILNLVFVNSVKAKNGKIIIILVLNFPSKFVEKNFQSVSRSDTLREQSASNHAKLLFLQYLVLTN